MNLLFVLKYTEITGVGTFNYTLIKAIKDKYPTFVIDILFHSDIRDSLIIRQLSRIVDNVYFDIPTKTYDIIYTNYNEPRIPSYKRLYHFQHNIMMVDAFNNRADKVFCFSERSLSHVNHNNKVLIRNGIDINRFKNIGSSLEGDKVLVLDSRNNSFLMSKTLAACSTLNKYCSFLGEDKNNNISNRWNTEDYISKSDIVIGVGRSAIESLAMGKTVLIMNVNQANGLVTKDNIELHSDTNFSGWTKYRQDNFDSSYIAKQLNRYKQENLRDYIVANYDINLYIDRILN